MRERLRAPWALATGIGAVAAAVYLTVGPPAADLAAATYRSDLFARVGLTLRDSGWYAAHGHYLPGYSLLSPALGALLGVRVVLALSAVAAGALFGGIAERAFGATAARVAAVWFSVGFCVGLLSGRVPYDLGFAVGLGSLLALAAGRRAVALALAILTSAASPVAGAFLALAGMADALGAAGWSEGGEGEGAAQWGNGLALAAAALGPIVALALAFGEGGWEPFAASAFWPALAGVLLIAMLLPRGALSPDVWRGVRVGAALYALALVGAFRLHTPMGGNAARLGALLAGPILAGVLWDRHRRVLYLLAPVLLYWQLVTPIRDLSAVAGDPSVRVSYYAPLLAQLDRGRAQLDRGRAQLDRGRAPLDRGRAPLDRGRGAGPVRVEVPLTGAHWEAVYVAGHRGLALARGWERQLDIRYASLFYRPGLAPSGYRAWLEENGVAYVALPDVRLDYAGRAEGRLIAGGVPYLREVWHSAHWRLYRVLD